jgi:hypothetical protein
MGLSLGQRDKTLQINQSISNGNFAMRASELSFLRKTKVTTEKKTPIDIKVETKSKLEKFTISWERDLK